MMGKKCGCYVQLFILVLFSFLFKPTYTNTYYVSTTGSSDSYPGTISQPWATWQKAFDEAEAGDTVYFRGGIYYSTKPSVINPSGSQGEVIGHNGTLGNPICFFNYPGEVPVLSCEHHCDGYTGYNQGIAIYEAQYLYFKGLTIRNVFMCDDNKTSGAISAISTANLTFENITIHNVGQRGYWVNPGAWTEIDGPGAIFEHDTTRWINCDVYDLCDTLVNNPGNAADGWKVHTYEGNYYTWIGCRVWFYSDDGIDVSGQGTRILDSCWAMPTAKYEGVDPIGGIEANGFKLGACSREHLSGDTTVHFVTVRNSLAVFGLGIGFYDLDYAGYQNTNALYLNNTSYKNGIGFSSNSTRRETTIWRNNIAYKNRDIGSTGQPLDVWISAEYGSYTEDHNSWDLNMNAYPWFRISDSITVTDADFMLIDSLTAVSQIIAPRKINGSLPALTFLKLAAGSDLIDAGVNVGIPFSGTAPDMGYSEYYVPAIPVTGITVTGAGGATTITTDNGTLQLTATVTPSNATIKTVTWSIINGSGQATISSTGLVTAVTNGTVTARATANGGSGVYGQLQITISNQSVPVTGIAVTGAGGATTITTDDGTLQLTATVAPANATIKTVTWTIINGTGQATINSTGLVTAVTNGTVTARATANDGSGVYGQLQITISNQSVPVTGITVTGAYGVTTINTDNGTLQLYATITPSNATIKTVTWSIINGTGQAVISSTGTVTAVANGTVTARATANDGSGVYGQLQITISNQSVPVTGITVTGAGGVTTITTDDGTLQLTATVTPANANNNTVTWSIINGTGQATISSTGLVTAVVNGTVTARATANDGSGVYGQMQITLSNQSTPVTGITVSGVYGATTISTDNGTLQLTATITPANATNNTVTWSIINGTGQASISTSGLVTAVDNGTITARATANDGSNVYGQLQITISNQSVSVTGITVAGAGGATIIDTDDGTLQMTATIVPDNATVKTVTWSVDNVSGQATISPSGLVTAVDNGTVTVRATANDGSGVDGTLTITISNQVPPQENHPPEIADQNFDVHESEPQEAFIGTILASDSDAGQSLLFAIESGNENGLFIINETTGDLSFSTLPVDFYSINQYELQVRVSDNGVGELSDDASIIVNLIPSAETYYFDPDNSEDLSMIGSREHPFDTWQKAEWKDGAVYLQKRGTISNEENAIEITADNVRMGAYGIGEIPEIVSQSPEYAIQSTDNANVTIGDISIKAEGAISCLYFLGQQSDNITIQNCSLECPEYGIRIISGGAFYISKNTVKKAINGIFMISDFAEINYNNFSGNQKALNINASEGDARIFNNVFCDNRKAIVADNSQTVIYNNIFYLTSTADMAIEHTLANCLSDYNIYYPEQSGFIMLSGTSYDNLSELRERTAMDNNSLTDDPMLSDLLNEDYEIKDGSPAIDAGIYIGPLEDMYGTVVPVGLAPDIGSCEKNQALADNSIRKTNEPQEDGILVYPNPARDYLTIEIQKYNISYTGVEILNLSGKVIISEDIVLTGVGAKSVLQLGDLPAGLYYLKLYSEHEIPVFRQILIK